MIIGALRTNPAALDEIGNGVLRQQDFSQVRDRQREWWDSHKDDVSELNRLRQAAGDRGDRNDRTGDPNPQPLPRERPVDPSQQPITLAQAIEHEARTVDLNALQNTIMSKHHHEFNEPLDMQALVAKARQETRPLLDVYNDSVSERRQAAAKTKFDAEIKAAEERGRLSGRQEVMSQKGDLPFPVGSSAPTTLSGLRKLGDGEANPYTLDSAVATLVEEMNRGAR